MALTGATSAEANNNVMATIRKTQEITEGKLNARIDDMQSQLLKQFDNMRTQTVADFNQAIIGAVKDFNEEQQDEEKGERTFIGTSADFYARLEARRRGAPRPPYGMD